MRNNGPSFLVYKSGWIAPNGLDGGIGDSDDRDRTAVGISSGDKHLLAPVRKVIKRG